MELKPGAAKMMSAGVSVNSHLGTSTCASLKHLGTGR